MKPICILLFTVLFSMQLVNSQNSTSLSKTSKEIQTIYKELQKNPNLRFLKRKYIAIFPKDSTAFWDTFMDEKQLYFESPDYIEKFAELADEYPNRVGEKLISLCIGLKEWEADGVGDIQHRTMQYANKNYKHFILLIKKLNAKKTHLLITFLADVENHDAYTDYKDFLQKLKQHKKTELLKKFEDARKKRKLQNHH